MFDIGFSELVIVAVVALLVLGPERLPATVRTVGMWVGRTRRALGNVQREISEELRIEEMRQAAKTKQEELEKQVGSMQRPFSDSLRDEILNAPSSSPEPRPPEPQSSADSKADTEPGSQQPDSKSS